MEFEIAETGIMIQEVDGSPSGFCTKLKFPNGTLTNNGDGSFTYNPEDIVLDDITVDILTVASIIGAADDIVYMNDTFDLYRKDVATAGTQYESQRLRLACSTWDTTGLNSEDKYVEIYTQGISSADGEAFYFNIKDQDANIMIQYWAGISETKLLFGSPILANTNDGNTGLKWWGDDQLSILVGDLQMIDFNENVAQDYIRIGYNGDVDVYIGPSGKGLIVSGADGTFQLQNSGYQYFYHETQSLADDGSIDIPGGLGGWAMVLFDEGAEWTHVVWNTDSAVTGIQDSGANVAYTDTDAKYCIFSNGGANVRVRNRIGVTKRVTIIAFCR